MISFEKVEIIGYGSILGPLVYRFRPGLNIIKANNGMGKTTIFNAWFWGLTGETLKPKSSINMWPHIQPSDYLGTKVTNYFSIDDKNYKVIRCNNFQGKVEGAKGSNRILIYENDKLLSFKGVAANKAALQKIIGYSPELFKNTLIFGQKLKRLIDEPGTNKKAVLEEAFDLLFISQAQERAQIKKKNLLEKSIPLKNKLDKLTTELDGKRELLSQALDNEKEFENQKESELNRLNKELKEILREYDLKKTLNTEQDLKNVNKEIFKAESKLKKLEPRLNELSETYEKLARVDASRNFISSDIKKIEAKIKKLKNSLNKPLTKCPQCGSEIGKSGKANVKIHIEAEIESLNSELNGNNKKYKELKRQYKSLQKQVTSLKAVTAPIDNIKLKIKRLEREAKASSFALSELNQYEKNISKLESDINKYKSKSLKKKSPLIKIKIKKLKAKIKPLKETYKALTKEMSITEWLVKDPLSNSGLKAYIFRDMIYKLNERMAYYSRYFGFRVEFEVDMNSARKDIDAFIIQGSDNIIPYEDLSGGQGQSVAVIIAFALHDIVVKGVKKSNVLIMDEIFENLDKNNIEKVTDIINGKSNKISLNLITHRSEFNPYNGNIINVQFKNGITSLVN